VWGNGRGIEWITETVVLMRTDVGDEMGLLGGEALWSEEERRGGHGWGSAALAAVAKKEMRVRGN